MAALSLGQKALQSGIGFSLDRRGPQPDQHRPSRSPPTASQELRGWTWRVNELSAMGAAAEGKGGQPELTGKKKGSHRTA